MSKGQKHLIKCRCVLPQYKKLKEPPPHKFIVFSVINDDNSVIQKYNQCNNCGIIHKIVDICTSEIIKSKENMNSILKIDDIKPSLHSNFVNVLESNHADLPTWEAVQHAIESKSWGEIIVLTSEIEGNEIYGKYIRVLGDTLCKVESFNRTTGVLL